MTKIKLNNVEVDKAELVKLYKEKSELFKEDENPLGDDFSMFGYLVNQRGALHAAICAGYQLLPSIIKRIDALIKIWEWKEKNDGKSGGDWYIGFCRAIQGLEVLGSKFYDTNTELPHFSSYEIAERALEKLEQEYKIVFNVK